LLVVKRSHTISRSSFRIPVPLSWICNSFIPPDFTVICMVLACASKLKNTLKCKYAVSPTQQLGFVRFYASFGQVKWQ
jgi:hypothetical protein